MTFNLNSLKIIESFGSVGVKGQAVYGYATNDTKATVEGANYFGGAVKVLGVGDIIIVSGDIDGTPFHTSYTVASNNGTTVTLTEHAAVTQNVLHVLQGMEISSKASDAKVLRFVSPVAGVISKIYTVLNAALATGDATVTAAINGVGVTNGVVTATQSGSAAGDVDSATPTAARTVAVGDVITLTVGGASTATATLTPSIVISPS